MRKRGVIGRCGFWLLALLSLPGGVVVTAVVRFTGGGGPTGEPGMGLAMAPTMVLSFLPVAPCGLPLAMSCRRLRWLGRRRTAWTAGIGLGAAIVAGLLGPVAVAVHAVVLSVPVWVA